MAFPDLSSLTLFIRTIDTGSLSKAAEQCHIALSAASRRITLLEECFNVQLLKRTSRGVLPTAAGDALAFHARLLLLQADRLSSDLKDHASGLRGIVRLASNTSALTQFVPKDLAVFAQNSPDIKIELRELLSSEILEAVGDGLADIGIAFPPRQPVAGISIYPYATDQLVAVAPSSSAIEADGVSFGTLLDNDLVVLESNTAMLNLLQEAATTYKKPLRIRVQVKSFEAICMMIDAGLGIGVLPEIAARSFSHQLDLRLVPLLDEWSVRQICLLVRDAPLSATVQQLLHHLLARPGASIDLPLRDRTLGHA
jgi:DNA-binding transcriptional LysR family regulator